MYFNMPCPHCQKSLKVRDELVGSTARCPHCRGSITVQRPSPAPGATGQTAGTEGAGESAAARSKVLSVTANTNVSVGLYILVGLAATVVFYLLLWPFAGPVEKRTYLGRLFFGGETASMATNI